MRMSAETKDLFSALALAQAELHNPHKSGENPHFKSGFAPLDEITDLIRPVMAKYQLAVIQDVTGNGELVVVGTMITHCTGQWIEQTGLAVPLVKKDAQGAMAAVTYARRYALLAMLNIVGTDDDDDGNIASQPTKPAEKARGNFKGIESALNNVESEIALQDIIKQAKYRLWDEDETLKIDILIQEAKERLK